MLILTAAQNTQPDYVALAIVLVLAVIVAIMAIRKKFFPKKEIQEQTQATVQIPEEEQEKPVATANAGCL